jgi:hypothetical protein
MDRCTKNAGCYGKAGHDGGSSEDRTRPWSHDYPADPINPSHYKTAAGIEAIDVMEAFGLTEDAYLCNATKYILRCGKKDNVRTEVAKAIWWLNRKLERLAKDGS